MKKNKKKMKMTKLNIIFSLISISLILYLFFITIKIKDEYQTSILWCSKILFWAKLKKWRSCNVKQTFYYPQMFLKITYTDKNLPSFYEWFFQVFFFKPHQRYNPLRAKKSSQLTSLFLLLSSCFLWWLIICI